MMILTLILFEYLQNERRGYLVLIPAVNPRFENGIPGLIHLKSFITFQLKKVDAI